MSSIRRHILLWVLPGFFFIWVVAGCALYLSVKQRYEVELDSELRELWAALPFGDSSGRASLLSIEDFAKDDFGIYFQVWKTDGLRILKSENLGRFDLPRSSAFPSEPAYANTVLENQDPVRTLSVGVDGGSLGLLDIVVAKTREESIASLRKVLLAISGVGAGTVVAFSCLLGIAIRSGLKPLREIGVRAESIETETLSARFPESGMPRELQPIVNRLNNLMMRLEEGFAREKRFGSDLAHELRTPVAALRSIAEVAIEWPDQATGENYEDILEISSELQNTIESLLTLARLENANEELERRDVNVYRVVKSSWETFSEKARQRELIFENAIGKEQNIVTDPRVFQFIVSNLLSNATEYAPEGTEIAVRSSGETVLEIMNEAPHLSGEDLSRMFDRLWRHDEARTDSSHSGLGLSIARTSAEVLSMKLEASLEGKNLHFLLKKGLSEAFTQAKRGAREGFGHQDNFDRIAFLASVTEMPFSPFRKSSRARRSRASSRACLVRLSNSWYDSASWTTTAASPLMVRTSGRLLSFSHEICSL